MRVACHPTVSATENATPKSISTAREKVLRHKNVRRLHIAVHDSVLMDEVEGIGDLGERPQPILTCGQHGRGTALDQLHRQPAVAVLIDGDDVRMVELMRELEFSSKPGGLVVAAMMIVENLQRHSAIRVGGGVRPVHGGVSATPEGGVDDIAFELRAGGKHCSRLGRRSGRLSGRMTTCGRRVGDSVVPWQAAASHPSGFPPAR